PAPQLLTSPPQRAQQLQTVGLAGVTLRPQATVAGRLLHQLLPAPPALDRARGRPPRRPVLPLLLLRVAAVLGDPASSRLHGLLVVGPPHTFARPRITWSTRLIVEAPRTDTHPLSGLSRQSW